MKIFTKYFLLLVLDLYLPFFLLTTPENILYIFSLDFNLAFKNVFCSRSFIVALHQKIKKNYS